MTPAAGTRLGPYEILAPLGAGGMGEVYRAKDTRLGREVAIKVLPERVATDPAALARFEREARAVAALSHPHILALHDFGVDRGVTYAVTELLEGETLADRLARGPMPPSEIAQVGAQVCGALTAAHRKGIVHRDLKPSNVMLTRAGAKLLDFGLAKPASGPREDLTSAHTAGPDITSEGSIVGTLAYMSPEQVEGRASDARSDIFALGATLYEMATGRKAFTAASQAGLVSAILSSEPPAVSTVQPMSPAALDRIVRGCLAKDPEARWQTAHDVGMQLSALGESGVPASVPAPPRRGRGALPWAVAALSAVLAAAALWKAASRPPRAAPARAVRFALPPPPGRSFHSSYAVRSFVVSPDGSRIAFISDSAAETAAARGVSSTDASGSRSVWIRELASLDARPVAGTEGAESIFWSPDGASLGFFVPGKLKRIPLTQGSAAIPICDLPWGGGMVGTWGADGQILFAGVQGATISRVGAAGGKPEVVVEADASRDEVRLLWPWYLPDGRRFLYVVRRKAGGADLMFAEPGKAARAVAPLASAVQYVEPGWIVFARDGALLAQRFDALAGRVHGEAVPVAERVSYFHSTGYAGLAASPDGTIAFKPRDDVSRLVWFDRSGRELGTIGAPGNYLNLALDADGRRVFYDRSRTDLGTFDVWSWDLERGVETAVTSEPDTEVNPLALPGGKALVYSANRGGAPQLVRRDLATGALTSLTQAERRNFQRAQDLSPDGRTLAYVEREAQAGSFDIWTMPVDPPGAPRPFSRTPAEEAFVRFSPDGRYLAYLSNESGRGEVYVSEFPGPGEKVRVTSEGARLLDWDHAGRALVYLSADGRMMTVPVATSPALRIGTPEVLFVLAGRPWINFEISADGRRLLAVVPEVASDEQPLTVIVGWTGPAPGR